ncbi:HD domain-containing protein [Actinoplanes oblitus]|uniref:HD domain-containing protein n=1 Tax=Actinoplanes oblitus TaxID=3040509 RepID=A0ABY8W4B8_9ACTN|nr:HD domain-containing protein [Actinoplanes oblitus]WIM92665.1 HD domain-containing protein [Actinoplanes oblitus]
MELLARAMWGPAAPGLRVLPSSAAELLTALRAPARLGAHLRAVHDVAWRLTGWLGGAYPGLRFDRRAVLFGAATHDIGKVLHPEELSGPGSRHEDAGRWLLLAAGVDPRLARFAGSHGRWDAPGARLEDLLVAVADKVWKANRVPDLEYLVVQRLVVVSGQEPWTAFLTLDGQLDALAAGAGGRLAYQNGFPIAVG